jgi:glycosyltransferase involved in cell wall biosynthesis
MSEKRAEALLVTPLPPMETGLATYALRVIGNTESFVEWTVAYPSGSDPESLPVNVKSLPIEDMEEGSVPDAKIFQIGNSPHCFPVVQALYKFGGTVLFHEIVLHHMLRHCYLENNRLEDYRRELTFSFGPAAESVEKDLSNKKITVSDFDRKQKRYPLIGRILHSSHSAVCLNSFAASILKKSYTEGRIITIGHPLSKIDELEIPIKPYPLCFGMVGTNHPGRNLDKLIEAIELLRNDIPDSGMVLIGSGYPEGLPEWVTRTGRLSEKEYQGWIRTLDYVFDVRHPTCGETSGSLLEAMRAGISSIVTATGSFNNIPSDAVIRVLPDNIVQGIRSAVLLLEERPDLRKNLSKKAASYAEDTGSDERLVRDWKKVLQLAENPPIENFTAENSISLSPAWHEPPEGFKRDMNTIPVTWKFSGSAKLEGPECSSGALVTVWGEGTVGSIDLGNEPSVICIDGRVLRFSGNGWVSNVFWK